MATTDYASGGNRIGRPTNGVYPIVVMRFVGSADSYHIIKFNINTRAVTYHGQAPGGDRELQRAFRLRHPEHLLCRGSNAGTIRKWNVTNATPTEVTGGGFPKDGPPAARRVIPGVVEISADDRWFVMKAANTDWCVAWDSQTNTTYDMQFTGEASISP